MASDDILKKAKALLGNSAQPRAIGTAETKALPGRAAEALKSSGLDIYTAFDTTGSMSSYIDVVRNNIEEVTNKLLDGSFDLRLSMNGIGDAIRENTQQLAQTEHAINNLIHRLETHEWRPPS